MAKTMEIFKISAVFLVLVPLIGASRLGKLETENGQLKVELAQLKEMFRSLQAQMAANILDISTTKEDVNNIVVRLNDTEELEARVSVLEESMEEVEEDVAVLQTSVVNLADEVDNVETDNLLQDERINTLETEISDNENDIEELVDITTVLTTQVSNLEEDVASLDQRVGDLESGGGGNGNVTDLEVRVESLEELTSQLSDDVSSLQDNDVTQDDRISSLEEDVTSLDQRVEDLESGGGNVNITDYGDTAFLAAVSTTISSSQDPLVFDRDVINPGGHYNPETGVYTAPYDGIYQFSVHLQNNDSGVNLAFAVYVDDSVTGSHNDAWSHDHYRSTTLLLELQAGQTVHIYALNGVYGQPTTLFTYFSGYMISAN